MLTFATADEASWDAFLSVSAHSPYQPDLEHYLDSLLAGGFTKPEWCVVGLERGWPTARAALWALPDHEAPTDVVLIDADWDDTELATARSLLSKAHQLARDHAAGALSHHVDSPPARPQYQDNAEARVRLLAESGYELLRDGLRWRCAGAGAVSPDERETPSLAFRPLSEVGEEAFVDAMAATYQGTRDSWLVANIGERGLVGAAGADFVDYQGLEHLPQWWELAYTEEGALAGVTIGARTPRQAVVAYVGVVPEQRGRGLAARLVRRTTERLLASGAEEIGGDCDRDNVAMVKAFERAGFEPVARRRSYRRDLAL
jgi:RimJ/RimL family protein N-acetyltransferase